MVRKSAKFLSIPKKILTNNLKVSWWWHDKVPLTSQIPYGFVPLASSFNHRLDFVLFGLQTNVSFLKILYKLELIFSLVYGKFTKESLKAWKFWNITPTINGTLITSKATSSGQS